MALGIFQACALWGASYDGFLHITLFFFVPCGSYNGAILGARAGHALPTKPRPFGYFNVLGYSSYQRTGLDFLPSVEAMVVSFYKAA
jgi:hypothetical protein